MMHLREGFNLLRKRESETCVEARRKKIPGRRVALVRKIHNRKR